MSYASSAQHEIFHVFPYQRSCYGHAYRWRPTSLVQSKQFSQQLAAATTKFQGPRVGTSIRRFDWGTASVCNHYGQQPGGRKQPEQSAGTNWPSTAIWQSGWRTASSANLAGSTRWRGCTGQCQRCRFSVFENADTFDIQYANGINGGYQRNHKRHTHS